VTAYGPLLIKDVARRCARKAEICSKESGGRRGLIGQKVTTNAPEISMSLSYNPSDIITHISEGQCGDK
jgi:hypothetical protein